MIKPEVILHDIGVGGFIPGHIVIAFITSDGKGIAIEIPQDVIPQITTELIERVLECFKDTFYMIRPDLRSN